MGYGLKFSEVSKVIHPENEKADFGSYLDAIRVSEFSFARIDVNKDDGGLIPLDGFIGGVLYVEEGKILSRIMNERRRDEKNMLNKGDVLRIPRELVCGLYGEKDSVVYLFSGKSVGGDEDSEEVNKGVQIRKSFDYRDKYWGKIESIVSEDFSGKRMEIIPWIIGSMEYHMRKKESYYVQSGKLAVVLRTGRAEDKPVILGEGDAFVINPGVMHRRIALEDCILFETSTRDEDRDSYLVDDGEEYLGDLVKTRDYLERVDLLDIYERREVGDRDD